MFAVIFIPLVIVSRLVAFAHYLGDVMLGSSLAWMFTSIWGLFEPNWTLFSHVKEDEHLLEVTV